MNTQPATETAARQTAPTAGHNSKAIEDRANSLRPLLAEMDTLEAERSAINARIAKIRANWDAMGLNRHAVKAARQAAKLDKKKLKGYDTSYHLARMAADLPVQSELDLSEIAPPAPSEKGNGADE